MRKSEIGAHLPVRRGLGEAEAAVYIGISPSFFRRLVGEGELPRPRILGGRRIWDVDDLDAAFKALPHEEAENGAEGVNEWDAVLV